MRTGRGAGRPDRYRAWRQGRWAESAAVALLRITGWRILARDWKSPAGEIDIVARRRRTIAFIEVKTRDDLAAAGEAIGQRQQQRIRRAAGLYLARHPRLAELDARFDAVLVLPWRWPVFVRDAWR
jgi:putative endonuclease